MNISPILQLLGVMASLASVVALVLGVNKAFRTKAKIVIEPVDGESFLGFSIKATRGTVNHAGAFFGPAWLQQDNRIRYELVDEGGNQANVLIAGGPPLYFFPYEVSVGWHKVNKILRADVVITQVPSIIEAGRTRSYEFNPATAKTMPFRDKLPGNWEVAIQVFGKGLDVQKVQRYCLDIEPYFMADPPMIVGDDGSSEQPPPVSFYFHMQNKPSFRWLQRMRRYLGLSRRNLNANSSSN